MYVTKIFYFKNKPKQTKTKQNKTKQKGRLPHVPICVDVT